MSTYYDEKTKSWFCKFYYTNSAGERKQKKKRGFTLQREAKNWERTFLEQESNNLDMPFKKFIEINYPGAEPANVHWTFATGYLLKRLQIKSS